MPPTDMLPESLPRPVLRERAGVRVLPEMRHRIQFRIRVALLIVFTSTLFACIASAETNVSFPLQGYYHPGKYMPVHITHDSGNITLSLSARGAVDIRISPAGNSVTIPWLMVQSLIENATWSDGSSQHPIDQPFRIVGPNEQLIGSTSGNIDIAQTIFPNAKLIHIPLDPASPLPGSPVAWEALDAIVLDDARGLNDETIGTLLSAGTAIAVRGPPPDARWPWENVADFSVLRHLPAGPQSLVLEAAYSPVYSWQPELPGIARCRIFLAGVIFTLIVLGASLWRSPLTSWLVTVLSVAALAIFAMIRATQSHPRSISGDIIVIDPRFTQSDAWTFLTSAKDSIQSAPAKHSQPVFASNSHAARSEMKLICTGDGIPDKFEFLIEPNARIAFLRRSLVPGATPRRMVSVNSPLQDLVRAMYLSVHDDVIGQVETSNDDLPGIVILRSP